MSLDETYHVNEIISVEKRGGRGRSCGLEKRKEIDKFQLYKERLDKDFFPVQIKN